MVIVSGNYKHEVLSSPPSLFNIKICSANGKIGNVTARPGGRNEQKPFSTQHPSRSFIIILMSRD